MMCLGFELAGYRTREAGRRRRNHGAMEATQNRSSLFSLSRLSRSLVKTVNVGLSVTQIEDASAEEIIEQGGSVSPILTIEPRRRKFHRAITLTLPLPGSKKTFSTSPQTGHGKTMNQCDQNGLFLKGLGQKFSC